MNIQKCSGELYETTGLVDLQVNGFAGFDYNDPLLPADGMEQSIAAIRATGVRRFLPTVITGPREAMRECLANLAALRTRLEHSAMIAGFHVEGPHIAPEDGPRGAHPRASVRAPDFSEFESWQEATGGLIRLVTLSPHWPGAATYIERVVNAGCTVSIGHTNASPEQIAEAVAAGATMSTHLGNGAASEMRKFPNVLWEQLADDRLTASFIVDGIHLNDSFLRAAVRAKGLERVVLVTDASTPAGAVPGRYRLGEQEVDLTVDGRVVLAGQDRLAGSALSMDRAVANLVRIAGFPPRDALRCASELPARAVNIPVPEERVQIRL